MLVIFLTYIKGFYGKKGDYKVFIDIDSALKEAFECPHFGDCYSGLQPQVCQFFVLVAESCGIKARFDHYNCMVDLLSRAGEIEELESLHNSNP